MRQSVNGVLGRANPGTNRKNGRGNASGDSNAFPTQQGIPSIQIGTT